MYYMHIKDFDKKFENLCEKLYSHPLWLDTNWFLATGAPSSGKSTSLRHLMMSGYKINADISREYIVNIIKKGIPFNKSVLYSDKIQKIIFYLMTSDALELDPEQMIIHDYSLPDNIAFLKLGGLSISDEVKRSAMIFRFKKILIFEPLELTQDGIRTGNREDQEKLFRLLCDTYTSIGYDPVIIGSDTIKNRHKILLEILPKP